MHMQRIKKLFETLYFRFSHNRMNLKTLHSIKREMHRFFEPALDRPYIFIRSLFRPILWSTYGFISILFLRSITDALTLGNSERFQENVIFFIVATLFYFIIKYISRDWWWASTYYRNIYSIHKRYVTQFIESDNNTIDILWTGRIVSILIKWSETWADQIEYSTDQIGNLLTAFCFTIFLLAQYSWNAVWIFFFTCILMFYIIRYFNKTTIHLRNQRIDKIHEYDRHIIRIIMSKMDILQNKQTDQELKKLYHRTDEIFHLNHTINEYIFFMYNSPVILLAVFRIGFIGTIGYMVTQGNYTIGTFVGILAIFMLFDGRIIEFVEFYKNFTNKIQQVQKLWHTFDAIPKIQWYHNGNDFIFKEGKIVLKNISYNYWNEPVFKNFSIEINAKKKTAIVGMSGSGKTTLIKLIGWYLWVKEGIIEVDSQNLAEIALKTYYPHIGYLSQEPNVFDGTIRDNLLYGIKDITDTTDKILMQALHDAECDFVFQLDTWIDTEIWERGIRLSGGQRQRLAIAKIFVKNPEIILLDEPTSALDSFSEEKITRAMHRLFFGRTVIIVAHRLQTVREADEIIVLEKWNIWERGNHEQLSKRKWIYSKMLELQSGF